MRCVTVTLALIGIAVLAGWPAVGDEVVLSLSYQDAEEVAGSLVEVMSRVAPQLGVDEEELLGLHAVPLPERNEVVISGQAAALELARKVMAALDVPLALIQFEGQVIRTDNPGQILRLPEHSSVIEVDGMVVDVPHDALGLQRPVPRDLPTLVCVPNPRLEQIHEPGAGHRVVSSPRVMTMAGREGTVSVTAGAPVGPEGAIADEEALELVDVQDLGFVATPLLDGSISVVLTLYNKHLGEEPDDIELAYVAGDGEPWAFAVLPPRQEARPTTVFVVTVSVVE